jgi:4-methyl-5(b-hydroxyethyl)-thiazole monophosphate biosynthesis
MKHLMLFVDGFEDVEAIATLDVLLRGKEEVVKASLMERNEVVSKSGNKIYIENLIEDIDLEAFDSLIIPGGPGSFNIMGHLPIVDKIIEFFAKNEKLVSAICAAPYLVGRLGYYKEKNYTVYPGFEEQVIGGTYLKNQGVVVDGRFITAKSMFYSIEFGLAIYNYFHNEEETYTLKLSLKGE